MIIEFTVGNFLSFKEKKTLSLKATSITEYKDSAFTFGKNKLLKSVVLYGANSSGKSNLIKAMSIMKKWYEGGNIYLLLFLNTLL